METVAGSIIGTPMYMAPEQADGRHDLEDARTDLYSVTVLLHELMTLEHYLANLTELPDVLAGVKTQAISHRLADYTKYPTAPLGYISVATHGTQKDPAHRFQTAGEMVVALGRARDGLGDVVCDLTATRRAVGEVGRFVDRHPGLSRAIGYPAVLAVIGSLAFTVLELAKLALH